MSASTPTLVSIRALHVRRGGREVLRGVDLDVAQGGIFGLLGPNGAGKSSLIECLLGLLPAESGELRVAGIDVRARPEAQRPHVGALVQGARLHALITPLEALRHAAAFHTCSEDPELLLAKLGLAEKARARFDTLSTGQRQRALLALALLHRPALLVLDEPFTGLDPAGRRSFSAVLSGLRDEGRTVLLSTHDLDDAQKLCDHIAILDAGRVLASGKPAALLAEHNIADKVCTEVRPASLTALYHALTGRAWETTAQEDGP